MLEFLLSLVYPQKCFLCSEIIPYGTPGIFCTECQPKIFYINSGCPKCGRPHFCAHGHENSLCDSCLKSKFHFTLNRAVTTYDENISNIIYRFKYGKRQEYGRGLGRLMAEKYVDLFGDMVIDCVIPVPLHRKRYKARGFNQSQLLAAEIAKKINAPLICNALDRNVNTIPQSSLSQSERALNVRDAFRYNQLVNIDNKKILLVDDIFTTGNTMSSCANVLIQNGAANVYSYSLAIV